MTVLNRYLSIELKQSEMFSENNFQIVEKLTTLMTHSHAPLRDSMYMYTNLKRSHRDI